MSRTAVQPQPQIRRSEIAIALLFLVTAAAAITGGALLEPVLHDPADLAAIEAGQARIATAAALWSLNNIGFVFIALFAWPVLAPTAPFMARAYLTTRIIEAGVMMTGVMALVTLPGLATAGHGAEVTVLAALSAICLDAGMLPLLGVSGLFLTWPLLTERRLPVWLAATGLAGYLLVTLAGLLAWFGVIGIGTGDTGFVLVVPVALWEIVLMPIWLLWKGFAPAT